MTTAPSTDRSVAIETGALIHNLMWRRKINQTTVGQAIGVNQSTLSKKLRGLTAITVPELVAIAALLEVDPGDLLPRLDSNQQPFGYASPQVTRPRRLVLAA